MEASPAPTRVIGRYVLSTLIASGGMASVHLGRLLGPVGFARTVALKRLHENFAQNPEFVAMLIDEARLAARIRHPNVVPTLDVVSMSGELLLVMEYVAGESLSQLLKKAQASGKPSNVPVIVDIMVSALHGLHAAHEATSEQGEPLGIVHRDVSPQNILVGADGVTRVLDFGVAKAAGRIQQTREGQLKGKVHYMPPEQITGEAVDRTADVYAASVVLWEALTSRCLFLADSAVSTMYSAFRGNSVPPSAIRPEIPPALDAIVMRGMQRNPADRYPTAKAMASALEAVEPPITRSVVIGWVMENARDGIQRRAEQIAAMEGNLALAPVHEGPSSRTSSDEISTAMVQGDPALLGAGSSQPSAGAGAAPPPRASRPSSGALLGSSGVSDAASNPSLSAPRALSRDLLHQGQATPPGRRRRFAVLMACAAALGGGALALYGARPSEAPRGTESTAASSRATESPVQAAAPVTVEPGAALPAAAPPEPASAPVQAASAAPTASASAAASVRPPRARSPSPARNNKGDRLYNRD
jgi:eukaryotic-like serine/threonine-protein kinase